MSQYLSIEKYKKRIWERWGILQHLYRQDIQICCCCLVTQSCLILCNPVDLSPPGSSVHGISQAKVLEWVAISFSRGSSQPRDGGWVPCIVSYQGSPFKYVSMCFLKSLANFNNSYLQVITRGSDGRLISGLEDLLEEGMATHSSILAWRIPMDRGAWGLWSMGSQSQTWLSD